MDKELKKLLKAIEAHGFQTVTSSKGHIKVYDTNGHMIAVLAGTPSDHRSRLNELRPLKRLGFRWP